MRVMDTKPVKRTARTAFWGDALDQRKPSLIRRILTIPLEIVVGFFVVLDAIVRPLFSPLVRFLSSLRLIRKLEAWIGSLNPYVILVLLGLPFAVAEVTKVYAVILMAEEHFRLGMTLFIGAYVVSILVCERTFHAGKDQLLTIAWFKWGYDWVMTIKDQIVAWIVEKRAWQVVEAMRQRVRQGWRRLRLRLRYAFGMRERTPEKGAIEQR